MDLIVDTISFRVRSLSSSEFFEFLGIDDKKVPWLPGGRFNMNYLNSISYVGIKIGYGGVKGWDFYVHMSGKGCRTFEDLHSKRWNWEEFINKLGRFIDKGIVVITRLDLACDSFDDTLNLQRIEKHIIQHKFLSKCPEKSIRLVKFGEECLYVGSPQSLTLLRIYNKKLERGYSSDDTDIPFWYRCEMQLRDEHAQQVIYEWYQFINDVPGSVNIGKIYAGHCMEHVKFLTKPNKKDGCQSRIPVVKWWRDFLDNSSCIKWSTVKGSEYNMTKLEKYAVNNAGSSILTMIYSQNLTAEKLYKKYTENSDIHLRPDQLEFIRNCNNEYE